MRQFFELLHKKLSELCTPQVTRKACGLLVVGIVLGGGVTGLLLLYDFSTAFVLSPQAVPYRNLVLAIGCLVLAIAAPLVSKRILI